MKICLCLKPLPSLTLFIIIIVQSTLISFTFADSVKFADDLHLSASDLLTPNAASNTLSHGNFYSNPDHGNKVLPSDLSKILLKNSRLHSSLDHIDKSAPGSPGPVSRQRSRTLPQSESLPPVCITSDYHSRTNSPDITGKGKKNNCWQRTFRSTWLIALFSSKNANKGLPIYIAS